MVGFAFDGDDLSSTSTDRTRSRALDYGLWLILGITALFGIYKGFNPGTQVWGVYNWYLDYSHGFVKRGVMGAIFGALFDRSDPHFQQYVVNLHSLLLVGIAAYSLRMLHKAFGNLGLPTEAWVACFLLAACPSFGTLAYNTGYLDTPMLAAFLVASALLAERRFRLAAAVSVLGVLIHECFLFLWLPMLGALLIVGSSREDLAIGRIEKRLLSFAFLPAIAAVLFHSDAATAELLKSAPMSEDVRRAVIDFNLGASVNEALAAVLPKYAAVPGNVLLSAAYFLAPTIAIMLIVWRPLRAYLRAGDRTLVLGLLAFGSLSVLLIAWDLSRFLTMSPIALAVGLYVVSAWLKGGKDACI